jgi:ABC transporter substrate binding protein
MSGRVYHFSTSEFLPWIIKSRKLVLHRDRVVGIPPSYLLWATTNADGDWTIPSVVRLIPTGRRLLPSLPLRRRHLGDQSCAALESDVVPKPGECDDEAIACGDQEIDVHHAPELIFSTERRRIAALAIAARLPSMYGLREHADDGGLVSYGVALRENWRRSAYFVDKILKGTKPADLPVELPAKLELVINLKTAKALGLTVPDKLLALADEVIE